MVWCLHMGALPFWCACFSWTLVSDERREQLRLATDAWEEDVAQAQRILLERYRSLRSYLFTFLRAYSDAETWLAQWALHFSSLDAASSQQLELLLSQGKTLIGAATVQARKIVQEQAMAPIMGIVTIDASGEVAEIGILPLFPVVPCEDREQFFASLRRLAQWYLDMAAFIDRLKSSQRHDKCDEA